MKNLLTTTKVQLWAVFLYSLIFSNLVLAQEQDSNQLHVKVYNLESFSTQQKDITKKDITKELEELTPSEFYSHPDYGYLPYNAPCEDCYELLQNRTDSARMFVEKGTNGTSFYSQKCYGIFNIKNDNGQLISIDPRLKKKSEGIYTAEKQAVLPTELNITNKQSSFNLPNGDKFAFNRKVEMLYISPLNQITNLGEANWTNYTIGEEGIHVINAWPNVDIEIMYNNDWIKSNYIIKAPLGYSNGQIAFRDNLIVPSGFDIIENSNTNEFSITSTNSNYTFDISNAVGYDKNGMEGSSMRSFSYQFDNTTKQLSILVPVSWTTDINAVYPLTIDPTVTSSNTYSASEIYFKYQSSAYCPGNNTGCTYSLVVPKPANATLTGATFGMTYITGTGKISNGHPKYCTLSDAGVYITTNCGRDPISTNSYWYCNYPTLYGTCSGSGLDISGAVTCYTPTCSGSITFVMHTERCNFANQPNCTFASKICAYMPINSWSVTITGKTLETTTNKTYNVASCAGTTTLMNPLPTFGVPGYTYVWSNGATTSTINANNAQSPYTVTVTDACGVQSVVTFTVNCPLSVTLNNFTVEKLNRQVLLSWETASEKDNDYFLIERAGEDGVFSSIGKIHAIGNSNTLQSYSSYDENPLMGTSYYRLKIVDTQGNESISEVKSVGFDGGSELRIIPNPNKGNYQIGYHFPEKGIYLVELYSMRGEKLISNEISIDKSGYKEVKLDEVSLHTGVYFVKLYTNNQVLIEKMIIE